MKRLSLLVWLVVGAQAPAISQSGFSVGPLLAPFTTYAGDPLDFESPARYSTGMAPGIQGQFDFSSRWSVGSGIWYETASVKASSNGIFTQAYRTRQSYLTVPILLNFRLNERTIAPYFSTGMLLTRQTKERGVVIRPLLAAGLSYRVAPSLTLNLQPALSLGAHSREDRWFYPANRQLSFQAQLLYHLGSKQTL